MSCRNRCVTFFVDEISLNTSQLNISFFCPQAYSVICGQPMAFIAPTGLTLAFISGLYRFCNYQGLPFFPVYTWVGFWTSAFMILLGVGGAGKYIRLCTHFTDEVFNALLSFMKLLHH
jgi:hypothetical protein